MARWIVPVAAIVVLTSTAALAQTQTKGDARRGRQVFQQCAACHVAGGALGPDLARVVGRTAGSRPDYRYSNAMAKVGFVWDTARLAAFLKKPRQVVPGNKMPYAGMSSDQQIADLVAYMKTQ